MYALHRWFSARALVLTAVLVFCAACSPPLWIIYNTLSLHLLHWVIIVISFLGYSIKMWKQESSKQSPHHVLLSLPLTADRNPSLPRKMLQDHWWCGKGARVKGWISEITCIFIMCPVVWSPEKKEISSVSVRWRQLGENILVWKEAGTLPSLVQSHDDIIALGEWYAYLIYKKILLYKKMYTSFHPYFSRWKFD